MKLLKFGAEWCGPCKEMDRRLENFSACEYVHYDVDDDECANLLSEYNIRNVPVLILLDNDGTMLKKWVGLTSVSDIEEEIKSHQ